MKKLKDLYSKSKNITISITKKIKGFSILNSILFIIILIWISIQSSCIPFIVPPGSGGHSNGQHEHQKHHQGGGRHDEH